MKITFEVTPDQIPALIAQLESAQLIEPQGEIAEPTPGFNRAWEDDDLGNGPIHERARSGDILVANFSMTDTNSMSVAMPPAEFFDEGQKYKLTGEIFTNGKDWAHEARWSNGVTHWPTSNTVTTQGPTVGIGRAGKVFTLLIDSLNPTGNGRALMDIYLAPA